MTDHSYVYYRLLTQCDVCHVSDREINRLPCTHTLCTECLLRLQTSKCPECNTEFHETRTVDTRAQADFVSDALAATFQHVFHPKERDTREHSRHVNDCVSVKQMLLYPLSHYLSKDEWDTLSSPWTHGPYIDIVDAYKKATERVPETVRTLFTLVTPGQTPQVGQWCVSTLHTTCVHQVVATTISAFGQHCYFQGEAAARPLQASDQVQLSIRGAVLSLWIRPSGATNIPIHAPALPWSCSKRSTRPVRAPVVHIVQAAFPWLGLNEDVHIELTFAYTEDKTQRKTQVYRIESSEHDRSFVLFVWNERSSIEQLLRDYQNSADLQTLLPEVLDTQTAQVNGSSFRMVLCKGIAFVESFVMHAMQPVRALGNLLYGTVRPPLDKLVRTTITASRAVVGLLRTVPMVPSVQPEHLDLVIKYQVPKLTLVSSTAFGWSVVSNQGLDEKRLLGVLSGPQTSIPPAASSTPMIARVPGLQPGHQDVFVDETYTYPNSMAGWLGLISPAVAPDQANVIPVVYRTVSPPKVVVLYFAKKRIMPGERLFIYKGDCEANHIRHALEDTQQRLQQLATLTGYCLYAIHKAGFEINNCTPSLFIRSLYCVWKNSTLAWKFMDCKGGSDVDPQFYAQYTPVPTIGIPHLVKKQSSSSMSPDHSTKVMAKEIMKLVHQAEHAILGSYKFVPTVSMDQIETCMRNGEHLYQQSRVEQLFSPLTPCISMCSNLLFHATFRNLFAQCLRHVQNPRQLLLEFLKRVHRPKKYDNDFVLRGGVTLMTMLLKDVQGDARNIKTMISQRVMLLNQLSRRADEAIGPQKQRLKKQCDDSITQVITSLMYYTDRVRYCAFVHATCQAILQSTTGNADSGATKQFLTAVQTAQQILQKITIKFATEAQCKKLLDLITNSFQGLRASQTGSECVIQIFRVSFTNAELGKFQKTIINKRALLDMGIQAIPEPGGQDWKRNVESWSVQDAVQSFLWNGTFIQAKGLKEQLRMDIQHSSQMIKNGLQLWVTGDNSVQNFFQTLFIDKISKNVARKRAHYTKHDVLNVLLLLSRLTKHASGTSTGNTAVQEFLYKRFNKQSAFVESNFTSSTSVAERVKILTQTFQLAVQSLHCTERACGRETQSSHIQVLEEDSAACFSNALEIASLSISEMLAKATVMLKHWEERIRGWDRELALSLRKAEYMMDIYCHVFVLLIIMVRFRPALDTTSHDVSDSTELQGREAMSTMDMPTPQTGAVGFGTGSRHGTTTVPTSMATHDASMKLSDLSTEFGTGSSQVGSSERAIQADSNARKRSRWTTATEDAKRLRLVQHRECQRMFDKCQKIVSNIFANLMGTLFRVEVIPVLQTRVVPALDFLSEQILCWARETRTCTEESARTRIVVAMQDILMYMKCVPVVYSRVNNMKMTFGDAVQDRALCDTIQGLQMVTSICTFLT